MSSQKGPGRAAYRRARKRFIKQQTSEISPRDLRCEYCGCWLVPPTVGRHSRRTLTVDHLYPTRYNEESRNDTSLFVISCFHCNVKKGDRNGAKLLEWLLVAEVIQRALVMGRKDRADWWTLQIKGLQDGKELDRRVDGISSTPVPILGADGTLS